MSEQERPLSSYISHRNAIKLGLIPQQTAKPKKPIAKVSEKKRKQLAELKEVGTDDSLDKWFAERRIELKGVCSHCGDKSCKDSDEYYKFSIGHILPKAYFKSVATHPLNFVELCFWGGNHHAAMDNKILDLIDMNCFDEIVTKFCAIYPSIAPEERRRIPQILLQYVDTEK